MTGGKSVTRESLVHRGVIFCLADNKDLTDRYSRTLGDICIVGPGVFTRGCVRGHPHMASDDFGSFLTYLPTQIR